VKLELSNKDQGIFVFQLDKNNYIKFCPERGGIITNWVSDGNEILYFDETRFMDKTKSIRGGIPILFPICGNLNTSSSESIPELTKTLAEPELGEFDDDFTWSAMVLAAQGKKINQISLDEIDWLTKLRRGLEETRKGFVTELLDKLGDDPLTPESLDDLETLLIRADVGIDSTDKVISSLRTKLNEEVVGGEAGIKFLKKELKLIIDLYL